MHILARPERAALPASVGDGVEAVISFQKETDMATFVPISGRGTGHEEHAILLPRNLLNGQRDR